MQFFVVYIREAHALDGRSPMGGDGAPIVLEPQTYEERCDVAATCVTKLQIAAIPAIVDGIDNEVNRAYAAAPDRLYLVGRDGNIAYHGDRGPFGFKPDELEDAIQAELARRPRP